MNERVRMQKDKLGGNLLTVTREIESINVPTMKKSPYNDNKRKGNQFQSYLLTKLF